MSKGTNKVINFYGVRYELSQTDYDLVSAHIQSARQILASRGHILSDQTTKPEKLTDAIVKNLAGPNIRYYNYETNAWNTNKYNDYSFDYQESKMDTNTALTFKITMEQEPAFCAQYEMVAIVMMTIDIKFFPGWRKPINNPVYSPDGTAVVGNIIAKNRKTGEYELYCKSWVGSSIYIKPHIATSRASEFAHFGTKHSWFRAGIIAAHAGHDK